MRNWLWGAAWVAVSMAGSASAGPVIEFETEFRAVYGDYRAALFMTNSGSVENSVSSLAVFSDGWAEIKADYATTPPPQYADDPHWAAMLAEVDALLAEAEKDIGAGDLAAAHATLEKVREVFSDLHLRNGIQTFSDRMNAYHAEMEHVLGIAPGTLTRADLPEMTGRAAVLVYLAQDVIAHPPRDAAGDAGFAKLIEGFRASVEALDAAVKAGDLEALRGAMGNLKKPYSMLFLKFG